MSPLYHFFLDAQGKVHAEKQAAHHEQKGISCSMSCFLLVFLRSDAECGTITKN
jgi:hypothetical protein